MADATTSFANAPPALICSITPFIRGADVLNLWACGNTWLNETMGKHGGIKLLDLDRYYTYVETARWPLFVARFPALEELRLRIPAFVPIQSDWHSLLQDWPRSIRTLVLGFDGLFIGLNTVKLSTHFPALERLTLGSRSTPSPRFLDHLPNSLKSLSIDSLDEFDALEAAEFAKRLPRHLTSFETTCKLFQVEGMVKALPPGLLTLRLLNIALDKSTVKLLPPNLAELWFTVGVESHGLKMIDKLPRSLRRLLLHGYQRKPQALDCKLLPPQLESLTVEFDVKKVNLGALPRSITFLKFAGLSVPCFSDMAKLPPNLVTLRTAAVEPKKKAAAFQLSQMPRSLTDMRCLSSAEYWNVSDASAQQLPPKLAYFYYLGNGGRITSKIFANLPRSLRELALNFDNVSVPDDDLDALPPNLEELSLVYCEPMGDSCVPHLPKGLRVLHVMGGDNFTSQCLPHLPYNMSHEGFNVHNGELTNELLKRK